MNSIDFLIDTLLNEMDDLTKNEILSLTDDKKKILRALMNIKEPGSLSDEFLAIQDKYLKEEIDNIGITDVDDLKSVARFASNSIVNKDKIYLWKGDIISIKADAIVNAANKKMLGCRLPLHYCIDNTIHSFSGLQLRNECNEIIENQGYDEPTGIAKITKGYNLPSKYIIHTVGPIVYRDLTEKHCNMLESSYLESLKIAEEYKLNSIVFCSISTGVFNFPKDIASIIALKTVDKFLNNNNYINKVVFNVYNDQDYEIYKNNLIKGFDENEKNSY